VGGTDADQSVNGNDLDVNGTITRTAVATGAELVAYSGFTDSEYLEQPYNSDLDFGTGDFYVMGWVKDSESVAIDFYIQREQSGSGNNGFGLLGAAEEYRFTCGATDLFGGNRNGNWDFLVGFRSGSSVLFYVNGVLVASGSSSTNLTDTSAVLNLGSGANGGFAPSLASLTLFRVGAGSLTAEQIAKIYADEKPLFQENAACTLYGTSDAVTAIGHDPITDLLHVGTSDGRSDFQGLQRVNNTETAVSTFIAAADAMIVEE
jgi:hypothetical protein